MTRYIYDRDLECLVEKTKPPTARVDEAELVQMEYAGIGMLKRYISHDIWGNVEA
jgi:hypothetical protein